MAYQTPITIKEAIKKIRKNNYVLPSIQREFVWDTNQIEMLFDSLMRDYPISTFLFWNVDKNRIKDFQFYEFLNKYHEIKNRHNIKANLDDDEDVIAVLDGQQRLTSLYLALTGSYANKEPYKRWDNPNAFPERKLYLNLLSVCEEIEFEYNFSFLTQEEAENYPTEFWFLCSKILEFNEIGDVQEYLIDNDLTDTSLYPKATCRFAQRTLSKFFNLIHEKGTISYFLEVDEELDKVLQIFIRINSGGTKLSYSDLLLSIATAEWGEKDAREVIYEFVDEINNIGEGFNFNKDFVLKSCLVLTDIKDIKFKIDNFNKSNMSLIEKKWDVISNAIRQSVNLVAKLGYNRDTLMASNALIPIAYFISVNGFEDSILQKAEREDDRAYIKEWLARVFLKGTFGGTPDGIYPVMRNIFKEHQGYFPLDEIIAHYKGSRKSIVFTEDDIEYILGLEYGQARTFAALSLLYSGLNHNFRYHQDHIHPKSFFTNRNLKKLGVESEQIDQYLERYNKLANLQLLEATQNIQKKNKHFEDWLETYCSSEESVRNYLLQNHINEDLSLSFNDFVNFYDSRREIFRRKLISALKVGGN